LHGKQATKNSKANKAERNNFIAQNSLISSLEEQKYS